MSGAEPFSGWVDSHVHLDHWPEAELDGLLASLGPGYGALVPGVTPAQSRRALSRWGAASGVVQAVGVHPWEASSPSFGVEERATWLGEVEALLASPSVVAIGEVGLDAFRWTTTADRERCEWLFVQQLELAAARELPLVLHVVRAHARCLELLRRFRGLRGVVHAFGGSLEEAQQYARIGFVVGLGASVTRARSARVRRVAALVEPEGYLLETDAPWMRVEGTEGEGLPAGLLEVGAEVARLRGVSVEEVREASGCRFRSLFGVEGTDLA